MNSTCTYFQQIDILRQNKLEQTKTKHQIYGTLGALDLDDKGELVPPPDFSFKPVSNHPNGGFFGPRACGENYRRLLESHPVCIDPISSLAGGWMFHFERFRDPYWNNDFDFSYLHEEQKKYDLITGIGGAHHFCPDLEVGLELGWKGILEKIRSYREKNDPSKFEFYEGLENVACGIQNWIQRHSDAAYEAASKEEQPDLKRNLEELAFINQRLVTEAPQTFREACQWIAWYVMAAVMYNGSGAGGAIDDYLKPFYDKDKAQGILNNEEATFHLACLLLKDNQYYEIGGPNIDGTDRTNEISFLVLEAVHLLKIPTAVCVRVHNQMNQNLFKKAVEYLFKDRTGAPNFIGDKGINEGFVKNGYSMELARQRIKCGCSWTAIPGCEYTLNDVVKINFVAVFDAAFRELKSDTNIKPSILELWSRFEKHLKRSIEVIAEGIDFHLEHMHKVFPELVLNLLCHGPIEKGLDASNGGVEYYNMCVDGSGLATVADSFAAIEQRVEIEGKLTWQELMDCLDTDYKNAENVRLMLKNVPRYGSGDSIGDSYAIKISNTFARLVKHKPTPKGYNMIPGLFSWASTISMGKTVGATPNGRHAYQPISHGASPDPGFTGAGAPTAMAVAVASVQCGYGNTAPLQLDMDPMLAGNEEGIDKMTGFIKTYCDMGGTLININIINNQKILEAHEDPSKYPDLVVRVTGFSAYFASLSKEFRQLVVDRIVRGF